MLHRAEPQVLPLPAETRREAPECRAWRHTRLGTVCCPCQQKRARLASAAPGGIKEGGPRNALGHRPSAAPESRVWRHQRGGPRNALGHRPEAEVLPLPGARLPSAAPGGIKGGGGPETRSGTVQSSSAAPASRNALGHRPEPQVCCPASRNEARGSRVPRLAASRGGGARAPSRASSAAPASRNEARGSRLLQKVGGPETRSGTVQSLKCCPCQQKSSVHDAGLAQDLRSSEF